MPAAENKVTKVFDNLVSQGVYAVDHVHSQEFRALFKCGVKEARRRLPPLEKRLVRVLEVGCGAGAWIEYTLALFRDAGREAELYGSDVSENMIGLCRKRFADVLPAGRFFVGDILDDSGYGGSDQGYDVILAYDVVQQLPRRFHGAAVDALRARLSPNGVAIVFDNDRKSDYGRMMARKKFLTRWCLIPLVPRHFCYARYPDLSHLVRHLRSQGARPTLIERDGLHKKILLIEN